MSTKLTYTDQTIFNSHDTHQKLGIPNSNFNYRVTYISENEGQKPVFISNNTDETIVEIGASINEGGLLKTNSQKVEIRSNTGFIYRLAPKSEFSIENTIAGLVPVYYGTVYIFGLAKSEFINGGKYRTSCYTQTRPTSLLISNIKNDIDVYYTLDYGTEIYEYDEMGRTFPIFSSESLSKTELRIDTSKNMRNRYEVIHHSALSNDEINKIFDYFVNPINWR